MDFLGNGQKDFVPPEGEVSNLSAQCWEARSAVLPASSIPVSDSKFLNDFKLIEEAEGNGFVFTDSDGSNEGSAFENNDGTDDKKPSSDDAEKSSPCQVDAKYIRDNTRSYSSYPDGSRTILDICDRPLEIIDAKGRQTTFRYNDSGMICEMGDSRGLFKTVDGVHWAKDGDTKHVWNGTVTVDPMNWQITESGLDTNKRVKWNPNGSKVVDTKWTEPDCITEITDARGRKTTIDYDRLGEIAQMTDSRGKFSTNDGTNWFLEPKKCRVEPDWVGTVHVDRRGGHISELNDRTGIYTNWNTDGSVSRQDVGKAPAKDEIQQALSDATAGKFNEVPGRMVSRALTSSRAHDAVRDLADELNHSLSKLQSSYSFEPVMLADKIDGKGPRAFFVLTRSDERFYDILNDLQRSGKASKFKDRVDERQFDGNIFRSR